MILCVFLGENFHCVPKHSNVFCDAFSEHVFTHITLPEHNSHRKRGNVVLHRLCFSLGEAWWTRWHSLCSVTLTVPGHSAPEVSDASQVLLVQVLYGERGAWCSHVSLGNLSLKHLREAGQILSGYVHTSLVHTSHISITQMTFTEFHFTAFCTIRTETWQFSSSPSFHNPDSLIWHLWFS